MSNLQKKNLLLSKRHIRRIIADQTNIDIAACSELSEKAHIVHTSSEDSCDLDVEIVKKNHTFDLKITHYYK